MLKDTWGTERNWREYDMEKPMCVMGNLGRYWAQRGRYLAAQIPRTMREDHWRLGDGEVDWTVCPIRRITVAGSLSI